MSNNESNPWAISGVLAAISASLCCITPVLAFLAGSSGVAASFSWLEPFRPWLIGLTVIVLGFAWYQKLRPRTEEEIECACEEDVKPSFWHTKKFLSMVTIFAVIMLAFPYYADSFFPKTELSDSMNINLESTYEIGISGMTCTGCEEHVKHEISQLIGISKLEVSYEQKRAIVTFDDSTTNIEEIKIAVERTGYNVESINELK